MKLDPRIENESLIHTPFSKSQFSRGERGYFASGIKAFADLNKCVCGELIDHNRELDSPYWCRPDDGSLVDSYSFFIKESSLNPTNPKKKKFRPFTAMEFDAKFSVGRPIKFREKGKEGLERYLILNGYWHEQRDGKTFMYVYIGSQKYTLDELFYNYEWQVHYTEDFEPFGVEE